MEPSVLLAPALPKERSEHDLAAGTQAIKSALGACYERQMSAPGGVEISIESSLTLVISPDGTTREGVFNPPLSPTLMSCANEVISHVDFAKAQQPTRITLPIRLSRGHGR